MNKAPLLLVLALSLGLLGSYLTFFASSSIYDPPTCSLENSVLRYGRVVHNKRGKVHKLISTVSGPMNHAYRKLAEQSKTWGGDGVNGAFRATDGDTSDRTLTHTEDLNEPYLQVDLDQEFPIRLIRIFNRKDEFASRIVPFSLIISKVPFGESSLSEARKYAEAQLMFDEVKHVYVWNLTTPVVGRYVRMQLEKKNFLHIAELEVYSEYISNDFKFTPSYMSVKDEPPLVLLPGTFSSFLEMAAHTVNVNNPERVFLGNGIEITESSYKSVLTDEKISEYYISEGEEFIGDPKVCLVFLVTDGQGYNTNMDYLAELILNFEILSANYFQTYQYPIVIFYAWYPEKVQENIGRFRVKFPHLDLKFVDVSRHFPPHLPQHLLDNNVDMTWFKKGTDCAPGNKWALNYLHMGRFWSSKLWREPILQNYDLIWRLDADATIDKPTTANFLRDMWGKHKLFAYWCRFPDTAECDTGITEATEKFAQDRHLTFKHADKITPHAAYWGGFGVYATKFFLYDKNWLDYTDYLESLGGHYNHRWGEQNMFPKGLSLLLEFDQLYWIQANHFQIYHDHWPASSCLGVDPKFAKLVTKK